MEGIPPSMEVTTVLLVLELGGLALCTIARVMRVVDRG